VRAFVVAWLCGCLALTMPRTGVSLGPKTASIGSPNAGHLDHGIELRPAPYLRVLPQYAASGARWGVPGLVGAIERSARQVARQFPGSVLAVGDLSLRGGGELARHHSHESGRDADVGYYLCDAKNRQLGADRLLVIRPDGAARDKPGTFFDDARNWALVSALVSDRYAHVTQIFVAPHVRSRLLRYAEQMNVAPELRLRVAEVMLQPRGVPLHDDHFHVRIACPRGEARICIEHAVVYASRVVRPAKVQPRKRAGTDLSIRNTRALIAR
jgi:penicillin-insensitive murein endopeptidase